VIRIIALLAVMGALIGCGGGDSKPPNPGTEWDTSRGVRIVGELNQDEVNALHRQLDDLDTTVRRAGYEPIPHTNFVVQIVPNAPECGPIGFIAGGGCVAGQYLNPTLTPSDPRERIKVTREGLRTSDVVRYEGEHWTLWYRDRDRFRATQGHPPDHPILGEP
jgi:hypothetical protein